MAPCAGPKAFRARPHFARLLDETDLLQRDQAEVRERREQRRDLPGLGIDVVAANRVDLVEELEAPGHVGAGGRVVAQEPARAVVNLPPRFAGREQPPLAQARYWIGHADVLLVAS
jgi:hypothetical protein